MCFFLSLDSTVSSFKFFLFFRNYCDCFRLFPAIFSEKKRPHRIYGAISESIQREKVNFAATKCRSAPEWPGLGRLLRLSLSGPDRISVVAGKFASELVRNRPAEAFVRPTKPPPNRHIFPQNSSKYPDVNKPQMPKNRGGPRPSER